MPEHTIEGRATRSAADVLEEYRRLGLKPISGGEGESGATGPAGATGASGPSGPSGPTGANPDDDLDIPGLGAAGKLAIQRERDARRAAERAQQETLDRLAKLEKDAAEVAAAKTKAEEEEAARRGEFEKLANARAETITTLTGERDALGTKVGKYEETLAPMIEERLKALPDEAKADYPKDANALDQLKWVDDRAKLVAALMPADPNRPKLPITPRPIGPNKPEVTSLVPRTAV